MRHDRRRTVRILVAACVVFALAALGACGGDEPEVGRAKVSVASGGSAEFAGARVTIPANSSSGPGELSIKKVPAKTGSGVLRPVGDAWDISLSGATLSGVATVVLPFVENTEATERIAGYWNEQTQRWEALSTAVDPESNSIIFQTDHFSTFGEVTFNVGLYGPLLNEILKGDFLQASATAKRAIEGCQSGIESLAIYQFDLKADWLENVPEPPRQGEQLQQSAVVVCVREERGEKVDIRAFNSRYVPMDIRIVGPNGFERIEEVDSGFYIDLEVNRATMLPLKIYSSVPEDALIKILLAALLDLLPAAAGVQASALSEAVKATAIDFKIGGLALALKGGDDEVITEEAELIVADFLFQEFVYKVLDFLGKSAIKASISWVDLGGSIASLLLEIEDYFAAQRVTSGVITITKPIKVTGPIVIKPPAQPCGAGGPCQPQGGGGLTNPADNTPIIDPTIFVKPKLQVAVVTDTVRTEQLSSRERSFPVVRVRALDLQTGDALAEFEFGGIGVYPQQFALGGNEILAGTERLITAVNLETGIWRHIFEAPPGGIITRFALSHDGETLAVGVEKKPIYTESTEVVFLDYKKAQEISRISAVDSFPGFIGGPTPVVWRAENDSLEVVGRTYRDYPGDFAAITPYGTMVRHAQSLDIDPGGKRAALVVGEDIGHCGGLGQYFPDGIDVVDLESQRSLGIVAIPGMAVGWATFSPDGSELLIEASKVERRNGQSCAGSQPSQYYRWSAQNAVPVLADRLEVIKSWEGARFAQMYCGGTPRPRFQLLSEQQFGCSSNPADPAGELHIGKLNIGRVRDAQIIGFLEMNTK